MPDTADVKGARRAEAGRWRTCGMRTDMIDDIFPDPHDLYTACMSCWARSEVGV